MQGSLRGITVQGSLRGEQGSLRGLQGSLRGEQCSLWGVQNSLRGLQGSLRGVQGSLRGLQGSLRDVQFPHRKQSSPLPPLLLQHWIEYPLAGMGRIFFGMLYLDHLDQRN